jgi:formate-dependent phosphoribosylglycinamide formyltransferase (GAR transformylase)
LNPAIEWNSLVLIMKPLKILILGAGVYQLPLIKKAKELGLTTLVVSRGGDYPGFELADEVFLIDTTDTEAVLSLAKEQKIDGICTTGTDVALATLGKVAQELNLIGPSFEATQLATDKMAMKEAFFQKGVRTASFQTLSESSEAYDFLNLHPDSILKIADSSGSRGIVRVSKHHNLDQIVPELLKQTKKKKLIIENYISGVEFGAQALIQNGEMIFMMPHGDLIHQGQTHVPIGHYAPYQLSKQVFDDLTLQLNRAVEALKLDHCAINADFILMDDKVYVLEIGARAGATGLVELVSESFGIDYYECLLRLSLNLPVSRSFEQKKSASTHLLISHQKGILTEIQAPNHFESPNARLKELQFDVKPGHPIKPFAVGPDRLGHMIIEGDTVQACLEAANDWLSQIQFIVKSDSIVERSL